MEPLKRILKRRFRKRHAVLMDGKSLVVPTRTLPTWTVVPTRTLPTWTLLPILSLNQKETTLMKSQSKVEILTREQAMKISPEYVRYVETYDTEAWRVVNAAFAKLKRGQR